MMNSVRIIAWRIWIKYMNENIDNIKMLVLDVDGVLTDGGVIIHDDGTESKRFHTHDGAWIKIWQRLGFKTAIITGRWCKSVDHRMKALGIDYVYQKALVKLDALDQLINESNIELSQMAYMGDDVMDMPVLTRVGYAACVPEALDEIKAECDYVSTKSGGYGAVGECICYLIKEKGLWDKAMERYRR